MDAILMKGPYSIRNIPLMLKEWRPDFNLKRDMLRTLPLWITLPQLPLHLWGENSLSKIGSAIGVPLVMNECTANKLRISYAIILVEVDITKELTKEVAIKDCEGRKMMQKIEYEWKPPFCTKCQHVGHQCKTEITKQWKPKAKPPNAALVVTENKKQETVIEEKKQEVVTEESDGIWTQVPNTRDRGKQILTDHTHSINCENGFEALGVLNDLIVTLDRGPCIVILIETRVKSAKASSIRNKLKLYENYIDNYKYHNNGRIWITWDNRTMDLKEVSSSDQFIHCVVHNSQGDFMYWLTTVYGLNQLEKRNKLWKDLLNLKPNQNTPWCAIGDYNNVAQA
ncbi:uncharacterized protein LOC131596870 [Vicia villosa]|uniref:uncharacterized protein LOC131596870 n=1 Tax=Vicia villosa TaxID=3911 RepID=UPI00273A922B|nr:uncharacterized protein LOC131596870 [Vicia villosa]